MSLFRTTLTVRPSERVLEYVDGACRRVLGPGKHTQVRDAEYRSVLVLERIETTSPQEVLTSDGVSVRVTCAVRWRVTDPQVFAETALDPSAAVYLAVQVALRDALVDSDVDSIVRAARRDLGATLLDAARAAGTDVGVDVRDVVVKDVILPAELRAAYAEQVSARVRGLAQLESARAETAALRSLANGAKLLDDSPALARLRLLQSLPYGTTVKLTLDD